MRRSSSGALALVPAAAIGGLVLAVALPARAAEDVASSTAEAYAAWKAGDWEAGRRAAEAALAAEQGVASLSARRVLVLCLEELQRPAEALRQVEDLLSFDLVPKDRAWAEERRERLRALVPDEPVEPVEPGPPPAATPSDPPAPSPTAGATLRADGPRAPALSIAAGGGWQRLDRWNYGAIGVDLAGRLVGPLRLVGGLSVGVSEEAGCGAEPPAGEGPCRSLLTTLSLGLGLRAPSPVAPFVDLRGMLIPQPENEAYLPVQGGVSLGGGVEFGPDSWPVVPRLRAAFELLSPLRGGRRDGGGFALGGRVLGEAVLRIGGSE